MFHNGSWNGVTSARSVVALACALASFAASAKPFGTQGLVSFMYGGGKSE